MKIATWNVNSIKARLEHALQWLSSAQPDVVLLQELKCIEEAFPYEPIEELGYNISAHGQKTYNGVAILSKYPLEDITKGLPPFSEDPQARYIEAVTNGIRVASVYVPNGQEVGSEKFSYKMKFYDHLHQHLKTLLSFEEAFVIGGDYNVAPYEIDSWKETKDDRILCSSQERDKFRRLIFMGLTNALRAQNPHEEHLYSWWDYRKGSYAQNHGYLIDHLLLSPQATDIIKDTGVDIDPRGWPRASDHTPVWCTLNAN